MSPKDGKCAAKNAGRKTDPPRSAKQPEALNQYFTALERLESELLRELLLSLSKIERTIR